MVYKYRLCEEKVNRVSPGAGRLLFIPINIDKHINRGSFSAFQLLKVLWGKVACINFLKNDLLKAALFQMLANGMTV